MLELFKKKAPRFFSTEDQDKIVQAIKNAELQTSGEVRVYIESRCRFMDAIDRASELFFGLKMQETAQRNGVLVYVAMKDRQLAVFADEGIYQREGRDFWNGAVKKMLQHFNKENYPEGIATVVQEIGSVLSRHFPYDGATDKNELPDEIVFGK